MEPQKAAEELQVIRQLMERPIRFSTMSGLSGIVAGCAALCGAVACREAFLRLDEEVALRIGMLIWAIVFAVACASATVLTRLREKRRGMPFWSPVKRRILLTILPAFVAGAGLTCAIVFRYYLRGGWDSVYQGYLIPAVWMLFYGLALWQVGDFSPPEVRTLGVAFLAAGLVTTAFGQFRPYWAMGLTFGGFHVAYGIVVWIRHGG